MSLVLIFYTLVDLIIIYLKIFISIFLKFSNIIVDFFLQKIGYMELDLHLSTLVHSPYMIKNWMCRTSYT
jgi:hypothetical protein